MKLTLHKSWPCSQRLEVIDRLSTYAMSGLVESYARLHKVLMAINEVATAPADHLTEDYNKELYSFLRAGGWIN